MSRIVRQYVLLHPSDCIPPHGLDMQSPRDSSKVLWLKKMFEKEGFDPAQPALVGYPLDGKVQLLTGTHRHMAASMIGMKLPVRIILRSDVQETWGTEFWSVVCQDTPVRELEAVSIPDGPAWRSPYPAVDFQENQ